MAKKDLSFRIEDVIAGFRSLEETDDAIVVLHDEPAMRVLVAWSHTDQRWEHPGTPPPAARHGQMGKLWDWIVSGWEINPRTIARRAGVPMAVAHAKLAVLMGNRLIYPDGSMSKGMRAALAAYTAKKLGIKRRQPAAEPAPARPARDDDHGN